MTPSELEVQDKLEMRDRLNAQDKMATREQRVKNLCDTEQH